MTINLNHIYALVDTHNGELHLFDSPSSRRRFIQNIIKDQWSTLYDQPLPHHIDETIIDNFLYTTNRYTLIDTLSAHSHLALASLSSKIKQRI